MPKTVTYGDITTYSVNKDFPILSEIYIARHKVYIAEYLLAQLKLFFHQFVLEPSSLTVASSHNDNINLMMLCTHTLQK